MFTENEQWHDQTLFGIGTFYLLEIWLPSRDCPSLSERSFSPRKGFEYDFLALKEDDNGGRIIEDTRKRRSKQVVRN